MAVTTRPSTAIVAPFAFVYVAQALFRKSNRGMARLNVRTILMVIAVLVLLAAVGYTLSSVFQLYTKWLDRLLRFFEHWDAIAGLLFSPGRGALFYAPIMLIALVGLVRFGRRHPWETLLVYGPIPFYLLMVSAHPMWWGGWNWGPRYLVPVMPLLLLPMISFVEPWVVKPSLRWAIVLLAGIALWSFLTQAIGVSIGTNSPAFETMEPSTFFRWEYAPFSQLGQANKISPDLAWLHVSGGMLSQRCRRGAGRALDPSQRRRLVAGSDTKLGDGWFVSSCNRLCRIVAWHGRAGPFIGTPCMTRAMRRAWD